MRKLFWIFLVLLLAVPLVMAAGGGERVRGWMRREPTRTLAPLWTQTPEPTTSTPQAPDAMSGPPCVMDWSLARNYENSQQLYRCAALLYPNETPSIPCPPIGNVWGESLWPPYCRVIDFSPASRTPYAYPGPLHPTDAPYPAPSTPLPYP